jgi:hypothetical protein
MWLQAVVIGVRRIIKAQNQRYANCARNRTAICKENRTRVDGPLKRESMLKVVGFKTQSNSEYFMQTIFRKAFKLLFSTCVTYKEIV